MLKKRTLAEKTVRQILNKLHQDVLGKGPFEIWVKINQNICTFYCSKTLTHLEEYLLNLPGGETKVIEIRNTIGNAIKNRLCIEIENKTNVKVLDITDKVCVGSNTFFGAILFDERFE